MLVALALNSKEYIGSSKTPVQTQVQQPVQQAQTTNPTPNGGIPFGQKSNSRFLAARPFRLLESVWVAPMPQLPNILGTQT